MKKIDKKRKTRKKLNIALNIMIILIFTAVFMCFGVCMGFLINSFINFSLNDIIINALLTLLVGSLYIVLLIILLCNKDIENVKPLKWYVNGVLMSFTFNFIITAITIFILETKYDIINYLVGFCIFPLIGIISTPNIVKYVKNDTKSWKNIFYKKGNLHNIKDSKEYYRVETPVSFEKKVLSAVYKNEILNMVVVLGFMLLIIFISVNYMISDHIYTGNVMVNIITARANRRFGVIFFLMIIFLAFGIPIIAFYIANALKKVRVVKNHEYIAYHVFVSGVKNGRIDIYDNNKHYSYKYCTCVGIKEKDVHSTLATLIFIPNEVLLFPDNEDYKVNKYNGK